MLEGTVSLGGHKDIHGLEGGGLRAPFDTGDRHLVIHGELGSSQGVRLLTGIHVINSDSSIAIA